MYKNKKKHCDIYFYVLYSINCLKYFIVHNLTSMNTYLRITTKYNNNT